MAADRLSPLARLYVASVVLAGGAVLVCSALQLSSSPIGYEWLLLAALTIVSSAFPLRVPGIAASLSVSETFVFTNVLLFGASAASITVAIDGLIISLFQRNRKLHRLIFNTAQPALSLWMTATVFKWIVPRYEAANDWFTALQMITGLAVLVVMYFVLNSGFNAVAVGLEARKPIWPIWWEFRWLSMNYFGGASMAALLSQRGSQLNYVALALLPPLLTAFYLTFRNWVSRAEEARQHLDRLNRLYLSTIETLAMAIDAKDQITHGHIRRVQMLAVSLAKALGIEDQASLKAIEAAALLHDMGKLAIPEHILNKPGKLSDAEFEQMKQHANIGADILSRIEFPYPVVPIVRHHHEWWSGGGYPNGLVGTNIPVGARILSVVDCYDALTSDRPYRRALSDEEALQVLIERRGTMYDPEVVDKFIDVYRSIVPAVDPLALKDAVIAELRMDQPAPARAVSAPAPADERSSEAPDDDVGVFYAHLNALASGLTSGEAAQVLAQQIHSMTPSALCVFYRHETASGELVLAHAFGANDTLVGGLRIPLGDRLTGWVGANRQTICNSDAALDLTNLPKPLEVPLHSCLATPLIVDGDLVGVLSLYAEPINAFSERDQRLVERIAPQVAQMLQATMELSDVQRVTNRLALARLPQFGGHLAETIDTGTAVIALALRIEGLDLVRQAAGADEADAVLATAAAALIRQLQEDDALYRDGEQGLVGVFASSSLDVADRALDAVRRALDVPFWSLRTRFPTLGLKAARASSRDVGGTLNDLVSVARMRALHNPLIPAWRSVRRSSSLPPRVAVWGRAS